MKLWDLGFSFHSWLLYGTHMGPPVIVKNVGLVGWRDDESGLVGASLFLPSWPTKGTRNEPRCHLYLLGHFQAISPSFFLFFSSCVYESGSSIPSWSGLRFSMKLVRIRLIVK